MENAKFKVGDVVCYIDEDMKKLPTFCGRYRILGVDEVNYTVEFIHIVTYRKKFSRAYIENLCTLDKKYGTKLWKMLHD